MKNNPVHFFYTLLTGLLLGGMQLAGSVAHAEQPPSVEQILARANIDRIEFLATLNDMERFAPAFPEKDHLFAWIGILDDLDKLSVQYEFEQFGLNPVIITGAVLTKHAAKWVHFVEDHPKFQANFMKFAEDHTRHSALEIQRAILMRESRIPQTLVWVQRIGDVWNLLREQEAAAYVIRSCEELQGFAARNVMKQRDSMNLATQLEFVLALRSESALSNVV